MTNWPIALTTLLMTLHLTFIEIIKTTQHGKICIVSTFRG